MVLASERSTRDTLRSVKSRIAIYILVCMSRLPFDLQRGHLNDSITCKEGFSVFLIFYYENRAMRNQSYDFFCQSLLTTYSAHTSERVKAWKVTVVGTECDGAAF